MPRQTSFQATEATDHQLADLRDAGFGTTTDVLRLAVDRMHREEIIMKESAIARRAGVLRTDSDKQIVQKIRAWIQTTCPDLPPAQRKIQARLAWQGIVVTWGQGHRIEDFDGAWDDDNTPA